MKKTGISIAGILLSSILTAHTAYAVARVPVHAPNVLQPLPENVKPNISGNVSASPQGYGRADRAAGDIPASESPFTPSPVPTAPSAHKSLWGVWLLVALMVLFGAYIALRLRPKSDETDAI